MTELPSQQPQAEQKARLRVSDRERERVVDLLSEHAAEGRLTLEELDARIDGAHGARTQGELDAITDDLPAGDTGGSAAGPRADGSRSRPSRQLVAFVAVNLVLVAVWALAGGGYFWPIWSILGWGIGLAKAGPCGHRRARNLASGERARLLTRATGAR